MSVNHFSSDHLQQHTLWWHHHPHHDHHNMNQFQPQSDAVSQPVLPENDIQVESLFEKSLTPSDVGKLNRLVIPKQHAERYFPLNGSGGGGGGGDTAASSAADKGLVLSFEDETGKYWRFRYSYWNSSQSYVLTKGWSRYVKEKQLDAGDVVFFQRHRNDSGRLFIGWRRRGGEAFAAAAAAGQECLSSTSSFSCSSTRGMVPYHVSQANPPLQPECSQAGAAVAETSQIPAAAAGNSKRLRLFGVNLECQLDIEPSAPDGSSRGLAYPHHFYSHLQYPPPYDMNITFSGEDEEMENRRG